MSSLEDIMNVLHETFGKTDAGFSPSTLLGELINSDFDLAMEFLLALEDTYNLEFNDTDVYGKHEVDFQEVESQDAFALLRGWSVRQLSEYIDANHA